MKTLYLNCCMGAAGDMLSAALYDLCENKEEMLEKLNAMGIEGVQFCPKTVQKKGITGIHMEVLVDGRREDETMWEMHHADHPHPGYDHDHPPGECCHGHEHIHAHPHPGHGHDHPPGECCHGHDHMHEHVPHPGHEHHPGQCCHTHPHTHAHPHAHSHGHVHASLLSIEEQIDKLNLPESVKQDAKDVYESIARAEAKVHGTHISEIHFHEVGTKDAIADICAFSLLVYELKPDMILASPVRIGYGMVRCAHGMLPVPAPATAVLLESIPCYAGNIESEMCTPTGAALLHHFVHRFEQMPLLTITKTGYGMGTKDFEQANYLQAFLAESWQAQDEIVCLSCNLDDMSAEDIGFAQEALLALGALDVYTISIGMKKCRAATELNVLCRPKQKEQMLQAMFENTTTLGIRMENLQRAVLQRESRVHHYEDFDFVVKESEGYGVMRQKIEFEDAAALAREKGISILEAREILENSLKEQD